MRHKIFIAGIVATGTALSAMAVLAQDRQGLTFAKLDANGDGQVTAEEIQQRTDVHFGHIDSDGNGVASQAELEENAQKDAMARVRRMLEKRDANGDGSLSPDELQARTPERMINRVDTDGNGLLSRAELEENARNDSVRRVRRMLGKLDTDGDGSLVRSELQAGTPARMIKRFDTDGNGTVSEQEFAAMRRHGGGLEPTN